MFNCLKNRGAIDYLECCRHVLWQVVVTGKSRKKRMGGKRFVTFLLEVQFKAYRNVFAPRLSKRANFLSNLVH